MLPVLNKQRGGVEVQPRKHQREQILIPPAFFAAIRLRVGAAGPKRRCRETALRDQQPFTGLNREEHEAFLLRTRTVDGKTGRKTTHVVPRETQHIYKRPRKHWRGFWTGRQRHSVNGERMQRSSSALLSGACFRGLLMREAGTGVRW